MDRHECERGGPAGGVADEVKPPETVRVRLTEDALDLDVEAVARWRLVRAVYLELLRDRFDTLPEHLEQGGIGRLGGQHNARQQHDGMSGRHALDLTPRQAALLCRASTPCDHYDERRPCRRPTTTPSIWPEPSPRSHPRDATAWTSSWNSSPRPSGGTKRSPGSPKHEKPRPTSAGRSPRRRTTPDDTLTRQELDVLTAGFRSVRDQEPLEDVADWANAVVALLEDEAARMGSD